MNRVKEVVNQRINELEQIIKVQEKKLKYAPEGKVHVSGTNKRPLFYFVDNGKRIYVKEKQKNLIQPICQKEYDQKVLDEARKELKELEKFISRYPAKACESIYQNLNDVRQQLVHPVWLPDDEYIKQWEAVPYIPKGFAANDP